MKLELEYLQFLWKGKGYYLKIEKVNDQYVGSLRQGSLYSLAEELVKGEVTLIDQEYPNYYLNIGAKSYDCTIELFDINFNNFVRREGVIPI